MCSLVKGRRQEHFRLLGLISIHQYKQDHPIQAKSAGKLLSNSTSPFLNFSSSSMGLPKSGYKTIQNRLSVSRVLFRRLSPHFSSDSQFHTGEYNKTWFIITTSEERQRFVYMSRRSLLNEQIYIKAFPLFPCKDRNLLCSQPHTPSWGLPHIPVLFCSLGRRKDGMTLGWEAHE